VGLAGSHAVPDAGLIALGYGWIVLVTGFDLVLALGLASLIGSRATTIGVLLGWQFLAAPLLSQVTLLGWSRQALYPAAFDRLVPSAIANQGGPVLIHSIAIAVVVLLGWTAVSLGAGAFRTATRDA